MSVFWLVNVKFKPDENRVPLVARGLNSAGNLFLSPVRCLFHGHSLLVINHVDLEGNNIWEVQKVSEKSDKGLKRAVKVVGSIITLIPGVLLGAPLKAAAMISEKIRNRYGGIKRKLAKEQTATDASSTQPAENTVREPLYTRPDKKDPGSSSDEAWRKFHRNIASQGLRKKS